MWRAHLADGRVVEHDGQNTPQDFLDLIVRFDVIAPDGSRLASLEPGVNERVIWRWQRANDGGGTRTEGVKVGHLNRDTGEVDVRLFDGRSWSPTDVVLTPAEVA